MKTKLTIELEEIKEGICSWCKKKKKIHLVQFPNEPAKPFCLKDYERMAEMKLPPSKPIGDGAPLIREMDNGIPEAAVAK